jgi:putative FmdB family regulatory protein
VPRYEYRCTACKNDLEVVQSFTDDALTECPECGGKLRRVFSSVGVVFKGSGFYKTDSRSGGSTVAARERAKEKAGQNGSDGAAGKDAAVTSGAAAGGSSGSDSSASSSGGSVSSESSTSGSSGAASSGGTGTAAA